MSAASVATAREPLSIGELAARSGRSVHALRWYETQGLMPGVVRDAGRRRVYSPRHVEWLELLDRLQRTGMTIAAMREYATLVKAGRVTLGERRRLLEAHRQRVLDTIADWKRSLDLIDRKIDFYDTWIASGTRPASASRGVRRR